LGSETRIAPREPTQARNIWYQGAPGCRSYASIPRGLRCEPWSGRAEDIGMNGDNQLHLGVMCRQSVEEADGLGCMCARCASDSGSAPCSCRGLGGRHAMPSPWKQVQGLLLRSRANFRPIDGRWSMNGARCGSEGARGVSQVVHNGKGSRTRPRGGAFEAADHRLSACYAARTRRQQEKARRPSPSALRESRVLVTMEGGNELNHAYECCRTYHTTSAPRATTGTHVHES